MKTYFTNTKELEDDLLQAVDSLMDVIIKLDERQQELEERLDKLTYEGESSYYRD